LSIDLYLTTTAPKEENLNGWEQDVELLGRFTKSPYTGEPPTRAVMERRKPGPSPGFLWDPDYA